MSDTIQTILFLFFLFQIKHTLADFFMQTPRMLANRRIYTHLGRLQHAGIHAGFTLFAALIAGLPMPAAVAMFAIDGVLHFHIDWLKGVYSERTGDGPDTPQYWRAFGVDQLAHQLTYIGMVWLWLVTWA